ncbi:MAG TPA: ATP-binding cassette domain-containing protein, partial [Alphaproteobacteria bacterium]|nr:ATP-binding cassette domain-containing protein [Alphaproteobacteria bacterium]
MTGLCTYYGTSQALFGAEISAPRIGGVAILGLNGAGKTTLLKSIVGELQPRKGQITFDQEDVNHVPTHRRIRRGLGYVPQEHAVFGELTVRENLLVGGITSRDKSGIEEVVEIFPKLGERMAQYAGTLSGGERKMLAIGRALLSKPKLLLLDEPTEGVWIGVIEEIAERLEKMASEISVVIVEQHVELALRIASHAFVM